METANRSTAIAGFFLIGIGVIFLGLNLIPGVEAGKTWPVIFYVLAAAFALPAVLFPNYRRGLAGLLIPAGILFSLALIFTYNVLADDYAVWAYAWLLIPAGVGLGLLSGALVGQWGRGARETGLWMMVVDAGLFALFATIFGRNDFIKLAGPILIIVAGVAILLRVFKR
jgi:hypothetical protein